MSNETAASIRLYYAAALGREPGTMELAYWQSVADSGSAPGDVRRYIAQSPEAQAAIAALYRTELGREPDAAGVAFWTAGLTAGASLTDIRVAIAGSVEAAGAIARIYIDVLGRAPEPNGTAYWTGLLARGAALTEIRASIASSGEAQLALTALYRSALDRAPDADGAAFWSRAENAGAGLTDIRAAMAQSAEAQAQFAALVAGGAAVTTQELTRLLTAGYSLASLRTTYGGQTPAPPPPPPAPVLSAALARDTGVSASDGVTQDATVAGRVTGATTVTASVDGRAAAAITGSVQPDGSFTLTPALLASLDGGTLAAGPHTVALAANGAGGAAGALITFTLRPPAAVAFDLAPADKAGPQRTIAASVTLLGSTSAGATVTLAPGTAGARTTVADAAGTFSFAGVPLALGGNAVAIRADDVAGAGLGTTLTIQRDQPATLGSNAVLTWNQQALTSIQALAADPEMSSRALAIESVAVLDTLDAINGKHGFLVSLTAPAGLDKSVAVAAAAHDVLAYLFPTQMGVLDTLLATTLAGLGVTSTDPAVAFGRRIAAAEIAIRDRDGWDARTPFQGGTAIGQWRPTAPDFTTAQQPQFATLQPWLLQSDSQFRAVAPPAVGSTAYDAALQQVKSLGSATSTTRTADQTQIARFWNDGSGSATPPGHWDAIALQVSADRGQSLEDAATTLAKVDVGLADAAIATWDTKYFYDLWRPITAIQTGDSAVTADPSWAPLIKTPPHPSYVSGHSTFSGAAATILTDAFGTTAFSTTSLTAPGVTRDFTSFQQAAQEAADSRVYAGIHFSFDSTAGLVQGAAVGSNTLSTFAAGSGTGPRFLLDSSVPVFAGGSLAVTGYALDNLAPLTALTARLDGGAMASVAVDAAGRFALSTSALFGTLSAGAHSLALTASDAGGRAGGQDVAFTVPGAGGARVSITAPGNAGTLVAGARLQGTVNAPTGATLRSVTFAIDGGAAIPLALDANGGFDAALPLGPLAAGSHMIAVSALDSQGGIGAAAVTETLAAPIPLTVTTVTPAVFASDVGVTYRPEVQFSRAVDTATLTGDSLYITDTAGNRVAATIVATGDGTGAFLLPVGNMPGGSRLTLNVNGALIRGAADGSLLDAGGTGAGSALQSGWTTVATTAVPGTTITGLVADPGADFQPGSSDDVRYLTDGTRTYLNPIAGVKVYALGHEDQAVFTDASGRFTLTGAPAGDVKIVLDGRTATNAPGGFYFPEMTLDTTVRAGQANTIMGSMGTAAEQKANATQPGVYLPRIAASVLQTVSTTQATTVTTPADAGITLSAAQRSRISLTVQPGSLVGQDGQVLAAPQLGVAPVPSDIVRDMLPPGLLEHSFDITIQAPGAALFTQPATLTLPNVFDLAPGEKTYILSFDHTTGRLVIDGTATASADGLTVTTDPGQGITKPGWHGMTPPVTNTHVDVAPKPKKPEPKKPDPKKDKGPTAVDDLVKVEKVNTPVKLSLVANDIAGTYPIVAGSATLTSQPKHGTATVSGGVLTYTSKDGKSDTFGYSEKDTKGNGSSAVIRVKGDCPLPIPLDVIGGTETKENAFCRHEGSFVVTNTNGSQPLLMVNGTADVWDDKVVITNSDVTVGFGALAGKKLLQKGANGGGGTFAAGTAIASTVQNSAKGTEPLLVGLGVEVTAIRLDADAIFLSGNLQFGHDFGDITVPLGGIDSSTPAYQATKAKQGAGFGFNGMVIDESGAFLGGGFIKIPDQKTTIFGFNAGGLNVELTGMAFSYDPGMDLAKIQGKFTVKKFWREQLVLTEAPKDGLGVVVDLSGENFIQVKAGVVDVVGSLEVTNIVLVQDEFSIPSLKIKVDTIKGLYTGSGEIMWKVGFTDVKLSGSISLFKDPKGGDFTLDGASVGFAKPIPIGATGVVFQEASFKVDGLNPASPTDFTLGGTLRLSYGPELDGSQLRGLEKIGIPVTSPFSAAELSADGSLSVLKAASAVGNPGDVILTAGPKTYYFFGSQDVAKVGFTGKINLSNYAVTNAAVTVDVLNGSFVGTGTLNVGPNFSGVSIEASGRLAFPSKLSKKIFGSDQTFGTAGFKMSFTDRVNLRNDYLQFNVTLSVVGAVSLRVAFDGSGLRLGLGAGSATAPDGATLLEASQADNVQVAGPSNLGLNINWANDSPVDVPILLQYRLAAGGPVLATYTEAQFAGIGASVIAELSGTGSRTVRLTGAAAGNWSLAIDTATLAQRLGTTPDALDVPALLGEINASANTTPVRAAAFAWGSLVNEDRAGYSASFGYTTDGTGTVEFYEADSAGAHTGLLLGRAPEVAGAGSFTTSFAHRGTGYIFAELTDAVGGITYVDAPFTLAGAEIAELATSINGPDGTLIAGQAFNARIAVTNKGTEIARGVTVRATFAGVELADSHVAGAAAPASADGTTIAFGDIKPGQTVVFALGLRTQIGVGAVQVLLSTQSGSALANPGGGVARFQAAASQPAPDATQSDAVNARFGEQFTADVTRLSYDAQQANTALVTATRIAVTGSVAPDKVKTDAATGFTISAGAITVPISGGYDFGADVAKVQADLPGFFASRGIAIAQAAIEALSVPLAAANRIEADLVADDAIAGGTGLAAYRAAVAPILATLQGQVTTWTSIVKDGRTLIAAISDRTVTGSQLAAADLRIQLETLSAGAISGAATPAALGASLITAASKAHGTQSAGIYTSVRDINAELALNEAALRAGTGDTAALQAQHDDLLAQIASAAGDATATLYAAFKAPDGLVQRTSFKTQDGITIALSPNTFYELTVFSPAALTVGRTFFRSAASGTDTMVPAVGLLPDNGIAGTDGLTPTAAYVVGIDNTGVNTLVPGLTDLAALQQGLVPASALGGIQGIVGTLSLGADALAITLAGGPGTSTQLDAFVGTATGLAVVDLARPTQPVRVGEIAVPGGVTELAYDAATQTVLARTATGLAIIDAGTFSALSVRKTLSLAATHVTTISGTGYATVGGTLYAIDLATGIVLQRLSLGGSGSIAGLAHAGSTLYTVDTGGSFRITTVTGGAMVAGGIVQVPAGGTLFAAGGTVLVGAASGNAVGGYSTVDVTDPAAPTLIAGPADRAIAGGSIALGGGGLGLAAQAIRAGATLVNALDVIGTGDPTQTGRLVTRLTLPSAPNGVAIAGGLGFVADGASGLQVVNYVRPTIGAAAPTVTITAPPVDVQPGISGLQLYAGQPISLGVQVAGATPIASTQLLVNDTVLVNAVSFPYDLTATLPGALAGQTVQIRVRTTDTGGKTALSAPIAAQVVPDQTPLVLLASTIGAGSIISTATTDFGFTFSRALDPAVAQAAAFRLVLPDGSSVGPQSLAVLDQGRTVSVSFGALPVGNYTLTIDDRAIRDGSGITLGTGVEQLPFQAAVFDSFFTNIDGGSWNLPANWSTGRVPTAANTVLVQLSRGTQVTFDGASVAPARLLLSGAQLVVTSATLAGTVIQTATGGQVLFADRGSRIDGVTVAGGSTIAVANNQAVTATGVITDAGTIALGTTGNYTVLLTTGATTLQGGGRVAMGAGGDSRIQSNGATTLTNVDVTIAGAGLIGDDGTFTLVNQGVIDGSSATQALILGATAAPTVNAGTLQGTGAAGLLLRNTAVLNTGGTIQALNGGAVTLQSASITGGRLRSAGGTIAVADRGVVLDTVSLAQGDVVGVNNNQAVTLRGVIDNAGTIALNTTGNYTVVLSQGDVTLQGGGRVVMAAGGDSRIQSNGATTLTNAAGNVITGAGLIGDDGNFGFVNQGLVDGSSTQQTLILGSGKSVVNAGVLRASVQGGLTLRNVALDNTQGVIQAAAGASVRLLSSALKGGRIGSAAGGSIEVADRSSTFDGVSVDAGSQVTIDNNQALTLVNNSNQGAFNLASTGNYTVLLASGAVSLANTTITLQTGDSRLQSNGPGTLTNAASSVITGAGLIGDDGNFSFVNQGLVDGTSTAQTLILGSGKSMVNAGVLRASVTAGLTLRNVTLDNRAGVIQAATGGSVRLLSSTLTGGRIGSAPGGSIEVADRGSTFDGVSVDAGSQVTINNNQALTLLNNSNRGAFNLASTGNYTSLLASGTVGLTNTVITMQTGDSRLQSNGAGTLTNAVTSVIGGAGLIGDDGNFSFVNQGLVDGNSAAQTLIVGSGKSMVNAGTLRASAVGGLTLRNVALDNTQGIIQAASGASVRVLSSTLTGGRIGSAPGGSIEVADRGSRFDGISVDAGSQVTVTNNQALTLVNNSNQGAFTLASSGNYTALLAAGSVSLANTTITMQAGDSRLQSNGAATLTNAASSVIRGPGLIGDDGNFSFVNQGLVDGDSATQSLIIGSGAAPFVNAGTLQGTGAAGLLIRNQAVTNTGTIQAVAGSVTLLSATLNGGALRNAGGTFHAADRGSVLDGVTLAQGSNFGIDNNQALTLRGAIINAGTIALNTAGNYTVLLTSGAVTLRGGGQVTMLAGGDTRIQSNGATTLTNVDNTITGTGLIGDGAFTLANAGTIVATGALTLSTAGSIANTGTLRALAGFTVANDLTGAGTLSLGGAGSFDLQGRVGAGQVVRFEAGATGMAVLRQSQAFAGDVSGLAGDASNALDLADISFATATASFTGTAAGGTLTVADGTHTAAIHLLGSYTAASWKLSRDAGGGTIVRDPVAPIDAGTVGQGAMAFLADATPQAAAACDPCDAMRATVTAVAMPGITVQPAASLPSYGVSVPTDLIAPPSAVGLIRAA